MDFVNRLRSDHLTSFWYFPSKVNFALVATFGSLLLATAPCQEEVDFYRARLGEYRWTLSVSAKNAGFLNFAIESLESSSDLLKALPLKPKIEELDFRQMPTPQLPIPYLIPPQDGSRRGSAAWRENGESNGDGGSAEDDEMVDAEPVEPIHSSAFQSQEFAGGYSGWHDNNANMSPITETNEQPFFFQSNMLNNAMNYGGNASARMSGVDIRGSRMSGVTDMGGRMSGMEMDGMGGFRPRPAAAALNGGLFAGTAFEGLGARNWFDNSHHGSPEAEMGWG